MNVYGKAIQFLYRGDKEYHKKSLFKEEKHVKTRHDTELGVGVVQENSITSDRYFQHGNAWKI